MILNATDADEPNHMNSKIAFKIVSQEPAGMSMFLISRNTGEVRTLTSSLDREVNKLPESIKTLNGLMASNPRERGASILSGNTNRSGEGYQLFTEPI